MTAVVPDASRAGSRKAKGSAYQPVGRGTFLLLLTPLLLVFAFGFAYPLLTVGRFAFDRFESAVGQIPAWSTEQFSAILGTEVYRDLLVRTLLLALVTTLVSILICYPLALAITRGPRRLRGILMALTLMPMLTSVVVKTFGWTVLLSREGFLQGVLDSLGIPVQLLFTPLGVVIGLVHTYMPFMALSLVAALARIDRRTEEAATSLGSGPLGVFFKVTLPQTRNGLAAGMVLTFVTSMSALVTPQLLGGGRVNTLVTVIYTQATSAQNWPLASALGLVLLAITFLILLLNSVVMGRGSRN
ncbi:ABC transporter permease [Ornithinimicrobium cavernae]|uniref:ABC transporter permease n=1 Tax=Ornithinimicrobium cavernae TaxID=2666047 RepID=UPI000D6930AC|nr:ABC transporter permease [Ornithinimicrobium cavernae]